MRTECKVNTLAQETCICISYLGRHIEQTCSNVKFQITYCIIIMIMNYEGSGVQPVP